MRAPNVLDVFVAILCLCALLLGLIIGVQIGRRRAVGELKEEYKIMAAEQKLVMTMIPDISENLKRLEKVLKDLEHEYEMIIIWNELARPEGGKR